MLDLNNMVNSVKTYLSLNVITIFLSIFFGYFLFNSQFVEPDYFVCSRIVEQTFQLFNEPISFNFPYSCDENEYFLGFKNFSFIIFNDHSYQQRPLYILIVFIFNEIFLPIYNFLGFDQKLGIYTSIIFIHSIILNLSLILILKIANFKRLKYYDLLFISLINFLQPMAKWGIFGPSVQMLTLLQIVLPIYLVKNRNILDSKVSLLYGLLFMYNRASLVSYVIYVFFLYLKNKKFNFLNFLKNIVIFLIPFSFYRLFFVINNLKTFDTNTETYQQFSWIIDYFTGGNRKYGEYFCHRIPGFIKCYLEGTLDLFSYLLIPLLISLLCLYFLFKNNKNLFYLILISTFIVYSFWSLIGWYPLRFIYYSIGNAITVLLILGYFYLNSNFFSKFLYSLPLIIYLTYLTMWNNPDPSSYIDNDILITSVITILIYVFYKFKLLKEKI